MYYYTYKITLLKGSLAGHYYYGQHRTDNLNDGYAGSGKKVTDYYTKYGRIEHQTYIKEIIAFYNNDDELNEAEKQHIGDKFETDKLCLNLRSGGDKYIFSEESKQKMSNWQRGRKLSEETKNKIRQSNLGKHHLSDEAKEKLRQSNLGKHHLSDEAKEKLRERVKRAMNKPEVIKRNSESHKGIITWIKGKHHSDQAKEKIRQAHLGKKLSEEHKEKIRQSMLKRLTNQNND